MQSTDQSLTSVYTDRLVELYQKHSEDNLFNFLSEILECLGLDCGFSIGCRDPNTGDILVRHCSDETFSIKQKLPLVRIPNGLLIVDRRQQNRIHASNVTSVAKVTQDKKQTQFKPKYYHAIPLEIDDQPYGYLVIRGPKEIVDWPEIKILANHLGPVLSRIDSTTKQERQHNHNSEKLTSLFRMTAVLREIELEGILAGLTELALSTVAGSAACLLLSDSDGENLKVMTDMGVNQANIDSLIHQKEGPIAAYVSKTQQGWVSEGKDEFNDFIACEFLHGLEGFTLLPLSTRQAVGCIFVANPERDTTIDLDFLEVMISLSCLCIDNAMLHQQVVDRAIHKEQLEIAGRVQSRLMPKESPEIKGMTMFGINLPCDDTSGDYFDYIVLPNNNLCFVLADAAGHGIGAAILATNARAMLRALLHSYTENPDLSIICATLNNLMESDLADDKFITMFIGIIEPGTNRLNYASAGHDPPLLIYQPDTGEFTELASTGLPIGMFRDSQYISHESLELRSNTLLILSSDGVPEAMNKQDEFFGKERVKNSIRTYARRLPADLCRGIVNDVLDFRNAAPQRDDITLIGIKID